MKGKFLLSVAAVLLPVSMAGQVAAKPAADAPPELQRYEVFAGVAYSSANQVKGSSALIGYNIGGNAKLKKWFGGVVDFGNYLQTATSTTHEHPTITTFLAGPEFYIPSDRLTGFLHVMFGGSHVANIPGEKPDIAYTYAVGGGFEYTLTNHVAARVSGDAIVSSFVLDPNNQGYSPHPHSNGRAVAAVVYRF